MNGDIIEAYTLKGIRETTAVIASEKPVRGLDGRLNINITRKTVAGQIRQEGFDYSDNTMSTIGTLGIHYIDKGIMQLNFFQLLRPRGEFAAIGSLYDFRKCDNNSNSYEGRYSGKIYLYRASGKDHVISLVVPDLSSYLTELVEKEKKKFTGLDFGLDIDIDLKRISL